jgi:hypothetical protein
MRPAASGRPQVLVIGVYPSAFHVAWTPPPEHDSRGAAGQKRPLIRSLAVDVEPVVFWDGKEPSPSDLLDMWKADRRFENGRHGHVRVGHNGPSGTGVVKDVLAPLKLEPADAAFTDAVPWFFVKGGPGSQGDAIQRRFAPVARELGVHEGSLPVRPTRRGLVAVAASSPRREDLRREIVAAGAPLVVTLGQEALDAVRGVADTDVRGVQETLSPSGYGRRGELVVDRHRYELLPLVHPGFRRQTSNEDWKRALAAWP